MMDRAQETWAQRALPGGAPAINCTRCGGLMVGEFCVDLFNCTGELECLATRCVQCGEIVDPVIVQNRQRQRVVRHL